jgi:hypothetical protein
MLSRPLNDAGDGRLRITQMPSRPPVIAMFFERQRAFQQVEYYSSPASLSDKGKLDVTMETR